MYDVYPWKLYTRTRVRIIQKNVKIKKKRERCGGARVCNQRREKDKKPEENWGKKKLKYKKGEMGKRWDEVGVGWGGVGCDGNGVGFDWIEEDLNITTVKGECKRQLAMKQELHLP